MKRFGSFPFILILAALVLPACGGGSKAPSDPVDLGSKDPVTFTYPAGSAVDVNGQLSVNGTELRNQNGAAIQLRGMSSHGLQWYGDFMNASSISWLAQDWKATVVRAAMYTSEGGYFVKPVPMARKVEEIVAAAAGAGIYVLIDWHILSDNDPLTHVDEAEQFFDYMSAKYGNNPHVLFEICNEPNGSVTWAGNVKPYANRIIPKIRANAPNAVVIVGSPRWSSDVRSAADDPLDFPNLLYTYHFYAGSGTSQNQADARGNVSYALGKGIAIFATEWGTTNSDGDTRFNPTETQRWIDFLKANQISWCNWSLSDKSEGSAALTPGAPVSGGWSDDQLSDSGKLVRSILQNP